MDKPGSGAGVEPAPSTAAAPATQRSGYRQSQYFAAGPYRSRPVGGARNVAVQWTGAIFCTIVLIVSLSVAGVYVTALAKAGVDAGQALAVIAVALAIGALLGVLLLYYVARTYAGIVYAALSLVLITGGLTMLVAAPVVRQMNTPDLAEYRGFTSLMWFGLLSTMLGVALGAFCLRWSMQREARRRLARWARVAGSAYGVLLGLSGILGMLALFSLISAESTINDAGDEVSVVEQTIGLTAIAMFSLAPGIILTYHGISESMGEGSAEFRAPIAALGVAAFGVVLGIGHLNMNAASPIALPMPVLHVLAAALPGATFAAMAGRGSLLRGAATRGLTWRQVTLAVAIAMSVATAIALYIEGFGSVFAIVLLLVHNGAFEFAATSEDVFNIIDVADFVLTENEQFAAGLIIAAVLAPVAEEFGKSLGVRFVMRATSTRAQCFLLGAAAGAGFGFLEAMLYGLAGVADDLGDWWQIMLLRGGSTSLHVICSGMAGVGWWYWSIARRHRVALGLFAGAMLIHAAWNGVFTAIDSRIFVLETLSDRTLEIAAYSIVTVACIVMIAAIPIIARRLRDAGPPPVEGTPLASMQAWLG